MFDFEVDLKVLVDGPATEEEVEDEEESLWELGEL